MMGSLLYKYIENRDDSEADARNLIAEQDKLLLVALILAIQIIDQGVDVTDPGNVLVFGFSYFYF